MLQNYRTKLLDYLSEEFEFNIIFCIYQGTDINAEYPNLNRSSLFDSFVYPWIISRFYIHNFILGLSLIFI